MHNKYWILKSINLEKYYINKLRKENYINPDSRFFDGNTIEITNRRQHIKHLKNKLNKDPTNEKTL